MLAAIRPDAWNLPLFVHVLGALALIGALSVAAYYLFAARRDSSLSLARRGYRSLLLGALPSYVVMRVGAQWVASKEGVDDSEALWITLGYASTEGGVLLLLGATIAVGLGLRRNAGSDVPPARTVAVAAWLVAALIVLYAAMIWIMSAKPA